MSLTTESAVRESVAVTRPAGGPALHVLAPWTPQGMNEAELIRLAWLGAFSGGAAHDIGNILQVLEGHIHQAQRHVSDVDKLKGHLTEMGLAACRGREIVREMLLRGRHSVELQPQRLDLICQEVLRLLQPSLPEGVRLEQELHEDGLVDGDGKDFHRIVLNLCLNSLQAMTSRGGTLRVRTGSIPPGEHSPLGTGPALRDGAVYLEIAVTGPGMDTEVLQKAFSPLCTKSRQGRGNGLGLYSVGALVAAQGGVVNVESSSGVGSVVSVYWPHSIALGNAGRQHEKVLVVDDEEIMLSVLTCMLERFGYRVEGYADGQAALDAYEACPSAYAAVVTDWMMPGINGLLLIKQIRAIGGKTPIILTTGDGYDVRNVADVTGAVQGVLTKPFSLPEMLSLLRKAIDHQANVA